VKSDKSSIIDGVYGVWLGELKKRIAGARSRAALAVNAELIRLYHHIGTEILERQAAAAWGDKIIKRIADDLRVAFPDMKGFSYSNLKYMKYFAENCPNMTIWQQPAAQLPWFHIVLLLTKVDAQIKAQDDKATIGLLLCRKRNRLVAQYAVNGIDNPMGIAEYQLLKNLPEQLSVSLPSIEDIETELEGI
jgi:predicted nuclease of restriction endonuclease-like (RecB) superfamily